MTNNNLLNEYINGGKEANAYCHLMYRGNILVNYSTVICEIDRGNKTAKLNAKKYSVTTTKIQNELRFLLKANDFTVEEYEGDSARWWNCGYMGAPTLTKQDTLNIDIFNI